MSQFIEMFKGDNQVPLGDICNIEKGATITRNDVLPGEVPVVAGGQEPSCYHNVANREAGAITVSASGAYAGYINFWNCPIFASDCNTIISKDDEKTDQTFVYFGLRAMQKQIYGLQKGGAQPHVYGKDLQKFMFPHPSYAKQIEFSKMAKQADKSEFVGFKSQFIEMYKDLLVNGKIEDLVDRKIASVKKSYHDSDEIEYIDISSIDNISNTIVETTKYEVSNAPSRAQQCVKKGDILVSTVRPINRNIAVVTRGLQNLVASTGFCVLRPKEEYREYLLSIVKSDAYTEHMCDKASGGLYPAVNNGDVFSYGIHIPNKELAQKVSTIHHQADKSEFELRKSIEAIDQVIKSLINDIK